MAKKITWAEPDDLTVRTVEINRSVTKYGTYSVIDTIDATSDGNVKATSNTWVTTYTDATGTKTNWYKIRFYDLSNYSDYSEPITSEEVVKLCTVADVKKAVDTVGRWTDTEIFDAIAEVEEMMYVEMGTPIQAIYSPIGYDSNLSTTYRTYYVGEENILLVDRIFYGTTTKTEIFLDDGYKTNLQYGMIRLLPVASTGPAITQEQSIEIRYVPKIYNRVAVYRTAKYLLERLNTVSRGAVSKELEVIDQRLQMVENILNQRVSFGLSSERAIYDEYYGVNRKPLKQNHDKNKYLANYGW